MLTINELYGILDAVAPFRYSDECIANGDYDNSGIIVNHHNEVKKILFSLDLTVECVKRAKREKADTIVTHHPAIYQPIKSLSQEDFSTAPVLMAVANGMNVISLHLNLDTATGGIDDSLATLLGGNKWTTLDVMKEGCGYGKQFAVDEVEFGEYVKFVKKKFDTDKIVAYGNKREKIARVASFCGAGSSYAHKFFANGKANADVIVVSDMPHHFIKEFVEMGKKLILIPHYVAEEYGFNIFYDKIAQAVGVENTVYFDDKRFR